MINGFVQYNDLEKIVEEKLKTIGITELDYPLDPYKIILGEGIILNEVPFDNDNIRGMLVHGDNASGIIINKNRSDESKKFIAMHELAHHWFHPHNQRIVCMDNYIDSNRGYEWQANNIASFALVPRKQLMWYNDRFNGDISIIAKAFGVSPCCIKYRLDKYQKIYDDYFELAFNIYNERRLYYGKENSRQV